MSSASTWDARVNQSHRTHTSIGRQGLNSSRFARCWNAGSKSIPIEAAGGVADHRGGRPAMQTDAEAGLLDVVLVHKLDRFARNLRVTLETLDRLENVRVGFASIAENMDFTSPIGKVILATLAAFAQYYSDNLSWETKKGKTERKRQGLYNGLLPFGIKKNDDGIPVPDPETYPGLLQAFRLAADGNSDRQIAEAL